MKNLIALLIATAIILPACQTAKGPQPKPYTLNGEINNIGPGWVFLQIRESGKFVTIDSTFQENGRFGFKGEIAHPRMVYLKADGMKGLASFFLDPAEININMTADDPENAVVTGSTTQSVYNDFLDQSKRFNDQIKQIYTLYSEAENNVDNVKAQELEKQFEQIQAEEFYFVKRFIGDNPKSVVAPYLLLRNLYRLDYNQADSLYRLLHPLLAGSSYMNDLHNRIRILENVQVGKKATHFVQHDTAGNSLSLTSLQGRYLLVDFWASWCGPCRRENPNVVAAYRKYSGKGFDILGVSLDTDREKWIKAIVEDSLTWHHVSDLKGWGNEAAALYGVNSIPANVLLDPKGIIVARNLREKALHEKLDEIFSADKGK